MPWESIALRGRGRDSPERQGSIHSASARVTISGRSMVERCPQSETTTSREPAMPVASSCESAGGVSASPSPTSHQRGTTDRRQQRPRIGARHDRVLLA
jgi:hypothetical protein